MSEPISKAGRSIRRHLLVGVASVALMLGGVGGWAATTELAGAVVAPGVLVVDSYVKKVQHPSGGIVGELLVRQGQQVRAGDVLIRLDATIASANLAIVSKKIHEFLGRKARLIAEREGRDEIEFPVELISRAKDPHVASILNGERRLMTTRRQALDGQKAQLRERILQLEEEIHGIEAQQDAKAREVELVVSELEGLRGLEAKKLITLTRLNEMERRAATLEGERGQLAATVARAKGQITETELQIIQIDSEMRSEVGDELRDVEAQIGELEERLIAARDELKRIEIRSPQDGFVHELTVHTVGGVIGAGETIMEIVPDNDTLMVEARIAPQDIEQLHIGQPAVLALSAFNQSTTPELNGTVRRISANMILEEQTGMMYYLVRIELPQSEVERLGNVELLPGMPADAFIKTNTRTVAGYLLKPLTDQLKRAFREE